MIGRWLLRDLPRDDRLARAGKDAFTVAPLSLAAPSRHHILDTYPRCQTCNCELSQVISIDGNI